MGVVPFEHAWYRQKSLASVGIAEFAGTALLCYAITTSLATTSDASGFTVPICIAGAIIALCNIFGDLSGAHFNPCITLPVYLVDNRFSPIRSAVYVCAQILGALAGTQLGAWTSNAVRNPFNMAAHQQANFSVAQVMICETIFTCLLALTALRAGFLQQEPNPFCPCWVAAAVIAASYAGGPISGACINPALAIGFVALAGDLFDLVVYIVAPTTGCILAALIVMAVDPELWKRRTGIIQSRSSNPDLCGLSPSGILPAGSIAILEGNDLEYCENELGNSEVKATKRALQHTDGIR